MSALDVVLAGLILAALVLAVRSVVRAKKQGKSCCGDCGSCSGCDRAKSDKL